MSVDSQMSRIAAIQREIESLNGKLVTETSKEASNSKRIAAARSSIRPGTSPSTEQSKYREIQRLEAENSNIQGRKTDLTRRISAKTAELHRSQNDLYKEQAKQQTRANAVIRNLQDQARNRDSRYLTSIRSGLPAPSVSPSDRSLPEYDAFISHASGDKEEIVRPLAEALITKGLRVWYDEFELKVGDSLRRKIDAGLSKSRFGVVVLSLAFFARNWPQYELDGLVAKEVAGGKAILPIWHRVSKDDVMRYSPTLADRFGLSTSLYTISDLADKLAEVLRGGS